MLGVCQNMAQRDANLMLLKRKLTPPPPPPQKISQIALIIPYNYLAKDVYALYLLD